MTHQRVDAMRTTLNDRPRMPWILCSMRPAIRARHRWAELLDACFLLALLLLAMSDN
jgi:hypothetical protein